MFQQNLSICQEVYEAIETALISRAQVGGLRHVVWIGAGGSLGGFYAAQYFCDHEMKTITSHCFTSNEFVFAPPAFVGTDTLAVVCSMRGTPETVEAARTAKDKGAFVIGLYVQPSTLTEVCDINIAYESIALDESRTERVNSSIALNLAIHLAHAAEGYAHYDDAMKAFAMADVLYRKAVDHCLPLADTWALAHRGEKTIYVMASGPSFGSAYIFSICNLEEMLMIDSPAINCCEFFHGPFEVIDPEKPVFLLVSSGRTRPLDERAIKFLNTYGGRKVYLLDAAELGIDEMPETVKEYFHHVLFSPILNNVYMRALSRATGKDYTTRRYMWQVEY